MAAFGSLVPGFTPMQTPPMQDTGLGAQGMKILQQAQQMQRQQQQPAQPGGQPGVQQPPMMGLLAKLFPSMMGQQPAAAGQPLSLTAPAQPAQPVMPDPVAPGSLSGLY